MRACTRAYSVNEVPETALSDEPGCGSARARTGGAVRVRSAAGADHAVDGGQRAEQDRGEESVWHKIRGCLG